MNSLSKLRKFLSIFLCLNLTLYSVIIPVTSSFSYASEVCDPEDDDYEACVAEQEAERLEDEEEDRQDAEKEKAEQEREEKEAIMEEHEDDPDWIAPWLITPSPEPSNSDASAFNENTGEGSENEANSNSASEINIENINETTLEEEINTISNTGNNVICQDCSPEDDNENDNKNNEEENDLIDEITFPSEIDQDIINEDSEETGEESEEGNSESEDDSNEEEEVSGESFDEGEEETSHEVDDDQTEDDFTIDASGENFSSGEDANVLTVSEDVDEVTVHNENELELVNELEVGSSSGENELSENEDNADLETGSGQSSAVMENYGNVNTTETEGKEGAEATNEETGDDSVNFTSDEVSQTLVVENENQAAVENNLSVSSASGENDLSENEDDANLTTGEVEIIANLLNILNLNITGQDFTHLIVNIFGNLTGEFDLDDIAEEYLQMDEDEVIAIARNTDTGDDSENTALANNNETLEINNENEAAIINNVDVDGVTGQNELSENEDDVNLVTGRIKILTSILNFINANFSGTDWYFAMINIFGGLTGDIVLPDSDQFLYAQDDGVKAGSSETGDNSQNQALASETEQINVTNNNAAHVENTVNATGDSGTNQALANEDETSMETGEIDVAANIMNWLDYNLFGNRWVMVVVNVFGRWLGRVIAFPGQGDIDAPENGTLVAVAGGEGDGGPAVQAGNEDTGDDSVNFAESSDETNWEVNNENTAYVENNVDVQGVSGQNETDENEDQANVVTGWIDLDVNLLNLINFNVAGQQWMLLIVNIFGDFFGDIVFPHEEEGVATDLLADNPSSEIIDKFSSEAENIVDNEADADNEVGGLSDEEDFNNEEENLGGDEEESDNEDILDDEEDFGDDVDTFEDDDWEDDVIITGGRSSGNQGNLITKNLRSFVFAGAKVSSQTSDDEEGLDNSSNNDYNQGETDEDSTYNEKNPVHISFWKIIEDLTVLLKEFLAHILPTH